MPVRGVRSDPARGPLAVAGRAVGEPRVGRRSGADDPRPRADERSSRSTERASRPLSVARARRPTRPRPAPCSSSGSATSRSRVDGDPDGRSEADPVRGRHRGALRPRRHRRRAGPVGDDNRIDDPRYRADAARLRALLSVAGRVWIDWAGATRPHHPARPPKPRPEASSDPRCAPRRADRRAHVAVLAQRGSRRHPPRQRLGNSGNGGNGSRPDHRRTERTRSSTRSSS